MSLWWDCRSLWWDCWSLWWDCRSFWWDCRSLWWDCRSLWWDCRSLWWDCRSEVCDEIAEVCDEIAEVCESVCWSSVGYVDECTTQLLPIVNRRTHTYSTTRHIWCSLQSVSVEDMIFEVGMHLWSLFHQDGGPIDPVPSSGWSCQSLWLLTEHYLFCFSKGVFSQIIIGRDIEGGR
jgi:hypothetical protein